MTTSARAINPWPHPACFDDDALLAQCEINRGRSGGPGGQNRNKVETLIELTHIPTGVQAHAGERRSQMENRSMALRRLRLALAVEVRIVVPSGEIGSALWRERRKLPAKNATAGSPPASRWESGGQGRIEVNPDHHDYPALLAEALDVISAARLDVKAASLRLLCSATQLIKLVRAHPPALVRLNHDRAAAGLGLLK